MKQDDSQPLSKRADFIAHETEGRRVIADARTAAVVAPSIQELLALERLKQTGYSNIGWGMGQETFVPLTHPFMGPIVPKGCVLFLKLFSPAATRWHNQGRLLRILHLACTVASDHA